MSPIIGTEAIASGTLTRGQLRWRYVAIYPDVYLAKDEKQTLATNAEAAWLWSRRTGIVAGRAAAGLHGVYRIGDATPIELIARHTRPCPGIVVREERIDADEVRAFGRLSLTTAARTALDLGRRLPRDTAVEHLDQLARASGVDYAGVAPLLERYRRSRGIARARVALSLMDGGSASPDETRLRLLLVDAGLPRPRTEIVVGEGLETAVIGMGWDEPKVGVSVFDGRSRDGCAAIQHTQRQDVVQRSGWIEIQVADLNRPNAIPWRVRDALRRRGFRG